MHRAINAYAMKTLIIKPKFQRIQIVNRLNVALSYINWAIYNWAVFQFTLMMASVVLLNSDAVRISLYFFLSWFIQHESFFDFFFWNFELNFWYFPSIANENDTIEPGNRAKSEHTCKYGNFTLNIGYKIKTTDPCLECSCETPPFAQCTRIITTESCH